MRTSGQGEEGEAVGGMSKFTGMEEPDSEEEGRA